MAWCGWGHVSYWGFDWAAVQVHTHSLLGKGICIFEKYVNYIKRVFVASTALIHLTRPRVVRPYAGTHARVNKIKRISVPAPSRTLGRTFHVAVVGPGLSGAASRGPYPAPFWLRLLCPNWDRFGYVLRCYRVTELRCVSHPAGQSGSLLAKKKIENKKEDSTVAGVVCTGTRATRIKNNSEKKKIENK